jgi:N-acetylneuraminic acid mutarotase
LPNGQVLVAGGYTGLLNSPVSTAKTEVYDPDTDNWTMTGSMSTARSSHVAILLDNGKVLVAGGRLNNMATATAELHDVTTGSWTNTGSMKYSRFFHTATLLENGKVLVTGGLSSDGFSFGKTAEIYDPATGTWSLADHMSIMRWGHSATLLENGNVLVAGGSGPAGDGIYTPLTELYDPIENKWRNVGRLNVARGFHAAVKLNDETALVAGGLTLLNQGNNITSTAEYFDPETEEWILTDNMTFARIPAAHGAVLLSDGRFLIAGGRNITSETYDSNSGSWTLKASMNTPRNFHTMTLLPDGTVLAVGGENRFGFTNSVELYHPDEVEPQ